MRSTCKWVMVAAVALSVAGMASAQNRNRGGQGGQGRGGFGGRMGGGNITTAVLLSNPGVQTELKITDDQKTKIKEFSDAQRTKMADLRPQNGEQPDREKMQEAMKAMNAAGDKFVKDTLNADQQKRITQIKYQAMLQVMGPAALTNDEIAKDLTLTDDQKAKVKTLSDDMRKDRQELMQDMRGGDADARAEAQKKMTTMTKDYTVKATDVLTADQKKKWSELTGEKFEYKPAQMGRRGGQGGGRRGGNNPPPPV